MLFWIDKSPNQSEYSKSVFHTDNSRVTTTKNHPRMYNTKSNKIKIIKQTKKIIRKK